MIIKYILLIDNFSLCKDYSDLYPFLGYIEFYISLDWAKLACSASNHKPVYDIENMKILVIDKNQKHKKSRQTCKDIFYNFFYLLETSTGNTKKKNRFELCYFKRLKHFSYLFLIQKKINKKIN